MTLTNKQIDKALDDFDKIKNTFFLNPKQTYGWCISHIKTILKALEMAKANVWQPIETCPDRKKLEFCHENYFYINKGVRWADEFGELRIYEDGDEQLIPFIRKPTHWRYGLCNFPTPPKESEA